MLDRRADFSRAGWTLADQAIVSLGNFLINIQLARFLPASEYGVFALLFSAIFLFQQCSVALLVYPMSLWVAAADRERPVRLMAQTMMLVAAINVVFSVVLAGVAVLAGRPDLALAAGVYSLLWQVQDAFRRSLMAEFRHRTAMLGDGLVYFSQAAAVAYFIQRGTLTLAGALMLMGCASAAGGLVQLRILRLPWPQLRGVVALVGEYWQSGRWAFVSGLLMHLRVQIFPALLTLVYGTAATAAFQASLNIANLTNPILFGLCNTISQAAAQARTRGGNEAAWRKARFYMLIGAPFVFGYAVAVFFAPGMILRLFYGAQSPYLAYELPVRVIMVAVAINYVADTYSAFLYGVDNGKLAFQIALVGLIAAALASVMIGPWGVAGAAGAVLVANLVRLVSSYRSMKRAAAPHEAGGKSYELGQGN